MTLWRFWLPTATPTVREAFELRAPHEEAAWALLRTLRPGVDVGQVEIERRPVAFLERHA